MKNKSRSVFKEMRGPVLPVFLACVLAPLSGFGGSLWREAVTDERGMFADKRAHRLGDIVTVLINESFESVNTKSLTTSRQAAGDPGLGTNLLNTLINGVADTQKQGTAPVGKFPTNLLPKPAGKAPAILAPPVNGSTNANTASVSNVQTLTNPNGMTVQVIDVLPNGNLVIEGIREVAFSKERQFASLRGIIRPTDILRDNTVKSSQVADARIDVVSEGDLSSTQKKGWLQRLDDKISPY